jgi:hypothetical protein
VATPGAIAFLQRTQLDPAKLIDRHRHGDWGDIGLEDSRANDESVAHEGDLRRQQRVLSEFTSSTGEKLWIVTEFDRSVTTLLLPAEY